MMKRALRHIQKEPQGTVYFTPFSPNYSEELFFEKGSALGDVKEAFVAKGYHVKLTSFRWIAPDTAFVFFNNVSTSKKVMRNITAFPAERMTSVIWEPPVVRPKLYTEELNQYFSTVLTWKKNIVDRERYFAFHYPHNLEQKRSPLSFTEKRLCTMMNANKSSLEPHELYSERRTIIAFYEKHLDDFDLYGYGWEPAGYQSYKGSVSDKAATIGQYRFIYAYENNENIEGYVTEKIIDAFVAGTVPIYRGASDILEEVPAGSFVDANAFASYDALNDFLKAMTEVEHAEYLAKAKEFLDTAHAGPFSSPHFVKTYITALERMERLVSEA